MSLLTTLINGVEYTLEVIDGLVHATLLYPKTVADLKDGDVCYIASTSGEPQEVLWESESKTLIRLRELGRLTLTKEEAGFICERDLYMANLRRRFIESSEPIEWGPESKIKYFLSSYFDGKINIGNHVTYLLPQDTPITTNGDWVKRLVVEEHDQLIKYYFGAGGPDDKNNTEN